ncbi:MAG: hypothetical protein ACXQTX_02385 [Candidatus Syntropharchaeia archaeon]
MKVEEFMIKNCKENWKELVQMAIDLIKAGKRTGDGEVYFLGLQLMKAIDRIGNTEIEIKEVANDGNRINL